MYQAKHLSQASDIWLVWSTSISWSSLQHHHSFRGIRSMLVMLTKRTNQLTNHSRDVLGLSICWLVPETCEVNVKLAQSCLTSCDSMDCKLPGSSVHRILQARILEWVAFPFSRRSSQPRDRTQVSHITGGFFTMSHQGSTRILSWEAYPFSRGSSQPRNQTEISCIAGRSWNL